MKKFTKRLLCAVLSVLVVLSVMPATFVSASEGIASVDGVPYPTLAEAIAVAEGKTVVLLDDVILDSTIDLAKNITINGNGKRVVPANADNTYNSAFMIGGTDWGDGHGETITLNDIVFEGWKANYAVVRAQGVTLNIDGCEFRNSSVSHPSYSILSSNYSETTVTDTKFVENNGRVIDVNYNAGGSSSVVTVDGCTFEKNTSENVAVIHRNKGTLILKDSVFTGNTVNLASNGATVYVGWSTGDEITGCTFKNNTVTTPDTSTKRLASAVFCGECVVKENVFGEGNTLIRNGEVAPTVVAIGAYYGPADISANYWNGEKPVEGENYLIEYGNYDVAVDTYYTDAEKTNLVNTAEEGPYLINTVEDLIALRDKVNAGDNFAGKYVILNDDIDMSSVDNWTPIGETTYNSKYAPVDPSVVFSGVFDGNNKKIYNLKIEKYFDGDPDTDANLGLFGITGEGAVIKDLTLTNVTINTDGRNVGALAGVAYKTVLENITVNGNIQIHGGNNVAGVCAMTRYYDMSATNIAVSGADGSAITGNNIVAGVFAEIAPESSKQTFENLSVENVAINGVGGVGGIVGLLTLGAISDVSVKDVTLVGKTTWKEDENRIRLGSVVGLLGNNWAIVSGATVENVTAKNLEGEDVVLPLIGANYSGSIGNATEAKIGDTYHATFAKAFAAAKDGDTITLLADVTLTEKLVVKDTLTIDLNGFTLSKVKDGEISEYDQLIENFGDLTIEDSVGTGNLSYKYVGSTVSTGFAVTTITNKDGATLTVNGGTIDNCTETNMTAYAIDNISYGAETTLNNNDGTITAVKGANKGIAIRACVNGVGDGKNVVNIAGGTITGGMSGLQIFNISTNDNAADINITGGTFNGMYAAYTSFMGTDTSSVDIEITDGEFNGYLYLGNDNEGSDATPFTASIEGGKFNGGVWVFTVDENGEDVYLPVISGGTFAEDVTYNCAEGFIATDEDNDGVYEIVIDFTAPALSFDAETRVLSLTKNDAASARVGVAFIGDATFEVGVDNWTEFVAFGKAYPNANGTSGYVVYSDFTERSFKTAGNYVAFVKYVDAYGETVSDYYVFSIADAPVITAPYFAVDGNALTLVNEADATILNVGAAYIGDQVFDGTTMGWNEFEEFGKAYTNYNGTAGYATYGASFTGKTFQAAGNYAGFVKYLDAYGNTLFAYYGFSIASGKTEYTLTYDETTRKFTMITEAENFTYRMGVAYIGDAEFDANKGDWDDFVAKGKANANMNGSGGYVVYVNTCPTKTYHTAGNYAAFVKYVDAYGNTIVDYYVFNIPKFNAPKLNFVNNTLTLDMGAADSARVGVAFIGKQNFDTSTMGWDEFVQMGSEYKNLNGSAGYVISNNFAGKTYGTVGNYVAFVKYADNYGATKADYMTFTVVK